MGLAERRLRERKARREAILDAAEEIIAATGYDAMKMEDVADAAELSKGTLYLYFNAKDALCAAIAHRNLSVFVPELRKRLTEATTGLDGMCRLLRLYHEFSSKHAHLFRFAISWLSTPGRIDDGSDDFQNYRAKVGEILALAVETIQRGQRDGSVRADIDPLPYAFWSWLSFLGVVMADLGRESFAQRIPVPMDFGQLVPSHIDAVVRALSSEGANP